MAKYFAITVCLIFLVFSVNSVVHEERKEDPSEEIIKHEDAEEGISFPTFKDHAETSGLRRRFLESLVCPKPGTDNNKVTKVSGDPPHMSSKVQVTCNAGKHFTGRESNKTMVTVQCQPLPHPCMCMAAWTTIDDFQLMYDFNCTSDIEDTKDNEKTSKPTQDDLPIYPSQDRNKDELQCPDPSPIRGTVKVISGKPFTDGCKVSLRCDPGLVFNDGKTVWNLTCVPVAHIPPALVWIPQYNGTPTCKEPQLTELEKQETTQTDKADVVQILENQETDEDKQTIVSRDVNEPTETDPPLTEEEIEVHEEETNSEPKHITDKLKNEIADVYEKKENLDNLEIDTYGPEEDLDGTFHENYVENNIEANIDDMSNKKNEIIVPSKWEENEEFTNKVSGSEGNPDYIEIYDDVINHSNNEQIEYEDNFNANMESDSLQGNNEEETVSEIEEITPSEQTVESSEMDGSDLENETEEDFSEPETSAEEDTYKIFPEIEENTIEVNFKNYEAGESSDEETEMSEMNEEVDILEDTEEENKEHDEEEIEEEYESENEVEQIKEEVEEANTEDIEAEMGEEYTTENEMEEMGEEEETEYKEEEIQDGEEHENKELEETEEEEEEDTENKEEEIQDGEEHENKELEETEEDEYNKENETENEDEQENNKEESDEDETEEENIELENNEENEQDAPNEEEMESFDEVHPLQPPSIKEPSIIYAAIKESSLFDKEENEEETENTNNDNLIYEEVEPPGSLIDIQLGPVEASKEQIQTNENDCSLPAETGPCRAYFRRFFFNSESGECEVFVYGGCQGNGNNFKTLNDCENTCVRKTVTL
ncbi:glutamic acid-rich protein-like isoform X6 [Mercenaria mercenaria]|uniref:glutamic acid-rich protein-like isoform X6 n=1 Tax=Mercenaria mercenaria TaxID=6596 RepID=UPI00234ED803|nr:glutamic acid-rich protein-like isoform X6 [Mercenaria mercenaria]